MTGHWEHSLISKVSCEQYQEGWKVTLSSWRLMHVVDPWILRRWAPAELPPFPNFDKLFKSCFVNTFCLLGQEKDLSASWHLLGPENWKPLHRRTEADFQTDFHMLRNVPSVTAVLQGELPAEANQVQAMEMRRAALAPWGNRRKKPWPPCDLWPTDDRLAGSLCLLRFHACELGLHLEATQLSRGKASVAGLSGSLVKPLLSRSVSPEPTRDMLGHKTAAWVDAPSLWKF